MSSIATRFSLDTIDWPAEEAIATERVLEGSPSASTLVLEDEVTKCNTMM